MFNHHTCPRCKKSLKKDFEFCPYCGLSQNQNNKWGMLGKNDQAQPQTNQDPFSQLIPGGLTGGILNKMVGNAMKMLENEIQKEMNPDPEKRITKKIHLKPNTKLQLYVNGKKINLESGQPKETLQKEIQSKEQKKSILKEFSLKSKEKFSNLPKQEPQTNIRRLSNKLIYELEMPGVKSINDIAIRSLEKSIEIRAISKEKAYYKIITVDLPLVNYSLEKDTLVLELEAKN